MPAIQEFLASYAVKVDEAGLYRLQQALEQNRDKASRVQAAFTAALSSVNAFSASLKDFTFHPDQLKLPESIPLKIMPELAQDAKLTLPDSFIMKVIPELDQDTPLSFPERIALKVFPELAEDAALTLPDSVTMRVIPELDQDTPLSFPDRIALKVFPELAEDAALTLPDSVTMKVIPELDQDTPLSFPKRIALKVFPELAEDAALTLPESVRMKVIPELDRSTPLNIPEAASVKVSADMTEADAAASDFVSRLSALRPSISANASGITTAVSNAVSRARSLVSGLNLTIKFTPKVSDPEVTDDEPVALGTGGRISKPTFAQIAEEGEPEYVIPVKNDDRAVPLLRQLFSELSADATRRLFGLPESSAATVPPSSVSFGASGSVSQRLPLEGKLSAKLTDEVDADPTPSLDLLRSDLLSANLSSITNNTVNTHHEVSAPVNIHVTSTGPTAEAVGKTVYNAAERALVRTLEGVFA